MSRSFQIQDPTWGEISLYVIHEREDGSWSGDWELIRELESVRGITSLFSRVSYTAYQDALRNFAGPVYGELGVPPRSCFLKVSPETLLECAHRKSCSMYVSGVCEGNRENVPPCFESNVSEDQDPRTGILVARVLELWRMGFYVIIAPDGDRIKENE